MDDDGPEAQPEKRVRVDVYHHFDHVDLHLSGAVSVTIIEAPPRPAATRAVLVLIPAKGQTMPGQITVDTTNETATLLFVDDKGDTNAAPPANASGNAVATFTSDNEATLTIATDSANPYQGDVSAVAEGSANIGCTLAYPDGSAVFE